MMYISKSRFINWTRCPMYFPMELKHNPTGKDDIDAERERREEILGELAESMTESAMESPESPEENDEIFDSAASPELEALLPYYNQVEDEALKVAKKYFHGTFIANSQNVNDQKLFEYELNGNIYRCYVDIYNENEHEINIIEVKATTTSKYIYKEVSKGGKKNKKGLYFSDAHGGNPYSLFIKDGNIWRFNTADSKVNDYALRKFEEKKKYLLDKYRKEGKYPYDLAFQRFVIEGALRQSGDKRPVNYYLAVLNSEYVYDGAVDKNGQRVYNNVDGQEIITFLELNETTKAYQETILKEIAILESHISTPHDVNDKVDVGKHCAWGENTQCLFWSHCFQTLRDVPDTNSANKYLDSNKSFLNWGIEGKYQLINNGYYKLDDVPMEWLVKKKHRIQRDCYDNNDKNKEYVDKEKMQYWFNQLEYPIYHFDFETFGCPLPRFQGEKPYQQSVFEFSLHIEREPGVCDKEKDNFIFLNEECYDDERRALAEAIIDHFEFNEDDSLKGTMLAQNTSFEIGRLKELAKLFPEYSSKLLAICKKSADLLHLLSNNKEMYKHMKNADIFNYYHKDLSGGYSIKRTLPALVPSLTYKGMDVGNGVQAYIAYINYDSAQPTFNTLRTKAERREALKRYCQQDTWAMVEILRAVRKKIEME